jgi:O-antigen ligase
MILALGIAAAAARDATIRQAFLRSLCISGSLAALYGIAQYFGWDPFLPSPEYHAGEGVFRIVRPPGTLGHSDYFGAFLLWPLLAGVGIACADSARRWKYFGAAAAGLASVAIVLSGSRAAVLGAVCGLGCLMFLSRPAARVVAVTVAVVVIVSGSIYFSPAGARLRARLYWIGDERPGGARLLLWRDSLSMAGARPIRGFGPENFTAEFPKYQSAELSRAYPDFYHESPHNFVLDALTAEGIPGVMVLAGLIVVGLLAGIKSREPALVSALVAAGVAHQFSVLTAPTAFCMAAAVALLVTRPSLERRRLTPPISRTLTIAACAAAALFFWTAVRFAGADHELASVKRRMDAGEYRIAAEQYRRTISAYPASTADLYFSRRWAAAAAQAPDALSKLSFSELANVAASRATQFPELRANAWYNLAALSATRNQPQVTEADLRSAITAAPNWFKPHWALARLLSLTGRRDEALREAQRASELNGGRDAEVTATFEQIARR